jgi:hypothetical protein
MPSAHSTAMRSGARSAWAPTSAATLARRSNSRALAFQPCNTCTRMPGVSNGSAAIGVPPHSSAAASSVS